jgi:hypothetical protein
MEKPYPIRFSGGIDRSISPLYAKDNFYDLVNLKHDDDTFGLLVPTSPFSRTTFTQATYYDIAAAGNATEPTTSEVLLIAMLKGIYFVITDKVVRQAITVGAAVKQSFYQTVYPAAESTHTGCKLVIDNLTGLGINLGSSLEVQMTGAATFQWRKNGGGWTAGVPSTAGVSIDGGNATLYFLENAGFAGTEAWTWTRTDSSYDTTAAAVVTSVARPFCLYNNEIYYVDCRYRICAIRFVGTSTTSYTISVGYRPVYGSHVCTFADHLIVGNYTTTAPTSVSTVRSGVIGNSDRGDLDNFISTSVNEADTNTLPIQMVERSATGSYLMGVGVVANRLVAVTSSSLYATLDLGLPLVFSFEHILNFLPANVVSHMQSVFTGDNCLYLIYGSSIDVFDGSTLKRISNPLADGFSASAAIYNASQELVILSTSPTSRLWVYQAKYGTFYSRKCDFGSSYTPRCLGFSSGVIVGGKGLCYYLESYSSAAFDDAGGTTFAKPTLVTQAVWDGSISTVKEVLDVAIGTRVYNTSTSSYWAGNDIQANLSYCEASTGNLSTMTSVATAIKLPATTGRIPFRQPFTAIAFELSFSGPAGDVTKPVNYLVLTALEPQIYGMLTTTEQ